MPMLKLQPRTALRIALSHYVCNGITAALGLLLISGVIHYFLGSFAAAAASVGVVVCIPADQPAPQRDKIWQLLPAALIGLPLFFGVQALHASPLYLGLLLVPATFAAFLGAAWGKRGLPISVSMMFAMIFSMAVPHSASALTSSLYFALGAAVYLVYATLANSLLNKRYRIQLLADTLLTLANLMRTQAQQLDTNQTTSLLGKVLQQQAALADQLQSARDLVLEAPRTLARQRLANMLLQALEMRDHLLACELDVELLQSHAEFAPTLNQLSHILSVIADNIEQLADDLLRGNQPAAIANYRPQLMALHWASNNPEADHARLMLARGLAGRLAMLNDEALNLSALAREEAVPDMAVVENAWKMFVSPMAWSWRPLLTLGGWDAPPLRHATRAALAIATGYALALALPWGTHEYWILLTIVVVLRGSLAQTLERRNSRVIGTIIGCALAGLILFMHPSVIALLLIMTLAQAFAHGFANKRYLITAIGATVLGLLQANMLSANINPVFEVVERIADTLIGAAIAWPFSYLLPSWERKQIPALVRRVVNAQARHATLALQLAQNTARPELQWRLARREAYNSLSALVQATQRSLVEPRAVRPPLAPLEHLLAHSYQLLAQLTLVKSLLLLRRERLELDKIQATLAATSAQFEAILTLSQPPADNPDATALLLADEALTDPFEQDLTPWLARRLAQATLLAAQLRADAEQVLTLTIPKGN